jgi:hypothetical protein
VIDLVWRGGAGVEHIACAVVLLIVMAILGVSVRRAKAAASLRLYESHTAACPVCGHRKDWPPVSRAIQPPGRPPSEGP